MITVRAGWDAVGMRTMAITYHVGYVISHACSVGTQQRVNRDVFVNRMVFNKTTLFLVPFGVLWASFLLFFFLLNLLLRWIMIKATRISLSASQVEMTVTQVSTTCHRSCFGHISVSTGITWFANTALLFPVRRLVTRTKTPTRTFQPFALKFGAFYSLNSV
jgi:hypothetical protein